MLILFSPAIAGIALIAVISLKDYIFGSKGNV
jgi:hypothetical protein